MQSAATTVTQYLKELPDDRRKAINAIRKVIKTNLDPKVKEIMQYGMIGYAVPHSVYPDGYHCDPKQPLPFLSLANQKNNISLYLFCLYTDDAEVQRFRDAWTKAGHKLDMGKSCVRFKKIEDVPLDVIAKTIKRMTVKKFITAYEASLSAPRPARKKTASKKKAATKKTTKKKTTKKIPKKASKKKTTRSR